MNQSPWGKVNHERHMCEGVRWVSTPGHGGAMVTLSWAEKHLSKPARDRGTKWSNYLCYEEDCEWAILAFEHPEIFSGDVKDSAFKTVSRAFKTVSRWNADYLIERGLTPDAEEYRRFTYDKEYAMMRKAKEPRLIVAASHYSDDVTKVWTADDKCYLVKGYKYPRPEGQHNLIEYCQMVCEYK